MRSTYKFGLITGVMESFVSIGFFSLMIRLNTGMRADNIRGIGGILTIIVLGIGIYISMRSAKNAQNGLISYKQALGAGVTVAIVVAVIMGLSSVVYCQYINPGYADYMVNEAHKTMIANGESPQQIAAHLVDEKRQFSTGMQIMMALVGQSVMGTIISLIMAIFIRSKKN